MINNKHLFFMAERLKQQSKTEYLHDKEAMELIGEGIWKIMEDSYAYLKGYAGAKDLQHFIGKSYLWKVITSPTEDLPMAFRAYKAEQGLKIIAAATLSKSVKEPRKNLKRDALSAYIRLMKEDFKKAWGEHSGKALEVALAHGGKSYRIPVEEVRRLLPDDEILPVILDDGSEDPFFYQRKIGGKLITKMAIGTHR